MAIATRLFFVSARKTTAVTSSRLSVCACSNTLWRPSIHLPRVLSYSTQESRLSVLLATNSKLSFSKYPQQWNSAFIPGGRRWWSSGEQNELPWTDIVTDQLLSMLKDNDIQLIDVRELAELEENGRIPQSIHVPLGEIEEAFKLSPEAFRERYGAVKPSMEDSNIVFHCRAGIRSRTAMTTVHELGYSKARHYVNGFLGWEDHLEKQN